MKTFAIFLAAIALAASASVEDKLPGGPTGICLAIDEFADYILDLKDPHIFYQCSNGLPILQRCPAGLFFNPRNQVCDYATSMVESCGAVGVCPILDQEQPVFLRDACDLSIMYECQRGQSLKLQCGDGLIFDAYKKSCVDKL